MNKYIALFLVLMIGVQPFQAGYCGMETGNTTAHQMQNMSPDDDGGHKCCNPDQPETRQDCGSDMLCSFCNMPVSTIPAVLYAPVTDVQRQSETQISSLVPPPHSPPLYRPPIS